MDKLKPILNYVKKFGFWFLLGAIVLAVLGCWWLATNSVAADVKAKRGKIDETFENVKKIAGNAQHPNQQYIESLEKEQENLKKNVLAAWKALYDEQQSKNPWPTVLGKEFLDTIEKLKPGEEIPYKLRGRYWNFIKEYFPRLKEVVDWWHPKVDPTAAPDAGLGAAEPKKVEMVGLVDWDPNDIAKLEKEFDWNATPSSKKVWLKQEDLWVMLSLLRVIKNTNEGVTDHSKAVIKRIEALDIGPYAVRAWREAEGQVFRGGAAATAGGPGGEAVATTPPAGTPDQNEDDLLLLDRYVDDNGAPLPAGTNPANQEFKMMPIRMKVYIDQRKIAKLLAQCANSEMPIEVRRVRIQPGEGEVVDFSGGGAPGSVPGGGIMAPGGMAGMAGERGQAGYGPMGMAGMGHGGPMAGYRPMGGMRGFGEGMGGPDRVSGYTAMPGAATAWEKSPMDILVEIQGIICIYNPPDINKLGKGGAGETPAAETPNATAANPAAPAADAGTLAAPPANTMPAAAPVNPTPVVPPTTPSAR